jgi:secreted protein with Ig-like and vWFA domain
MVLFPAYTTVITPAPYNAKNAAAATTALAGTATAAGATGTATGSTGAAATTKANAGNAVMTGRWGMGLVVFAMGGVLSF